jgi:hypothetical protein
MSGNRKSESARQDLVELSRLAKALGIKMLAVGCRRGLRPLQAERSGGEDAAVAFLLALDRRTERWRARVKADEDIVLLVQ